MDLGIANGVYYRNEGTHLGNYFGVQNGNNFGFQDQLKQIENIVTNGLVLKFDAGSRNCFANTNRVFNDLSGKNNNGILNGINNGYPLYNAINNGSIQFDGVDDYISLPNNSTLKPANITVSAWVKPGLLNKNQVIFDGGYYNSENGYILFIENTNKFSFYIRNSVNNTQGVGVRTVISNTIFNTNNWYNITGIYNGSIVYIYINGILENSGLMPNPINYTNSTNFWIGNYASFPNVGLIFQGNISQIQLYNRALSDSEVLQNYNALKYRYI